MGGLIAFFLSIYLPRLSEKEKQASDLQAELAELKDSLELHRKKNNVGSPRPPSTSSPARHRPRPLLLLCGNPPPPLRTLKIPPTLHPRPHLLSSANTWCHWIIQGFFFSFDHICCAFLFFLEKSFVCLRSEIAHIKTGVYFDFDGLSRCVS